MRLSLATGWSVGLAAVLFAAGAACAARSPALEGVVLSSAGKPVVGAEIRVVGTPTLLTRTDSLGRFSFDTLPADVLRVQVHAGGYRFAECPLQGNIRTGRLRCDLWLTPDSTVKAVLPPISD